jgi:hypothetical protein
MAMYIKLDAQAFLKNNSETPPESTKTPMRRTEYPQGTVSFSRRLAGPFLSAREAFVAASNHRASRVQVIEVDGHYYLVHITAEEARKPSILRLVTELCRHEGP